MDVCATYMYMYMCIYMYMCMYMLLVLHIKIPKPFSSHTPVQVHVHVGSCGSRFIPVHACNRLTGLVMVECTLQGFQNRAGGEE